MFERMSVFKRTRDIWHGSHYLNKKEGDLVVNVLYYRNIYAVDCPPSWGSMSRISVGSNCGYETDYQPGTAMVFDCAGEQTAFSKFLEVLALDYVDQEALKQLGFIWF